MPEKYRKGFKGPVPRGVSNRMAALAWLRENAEDGVFYFADDDNTYDYRLFAEVRVIGDAVVEGGVRDTGRCESSRLGAIDVSVMATPLGPSWPNRSFNGRLTTRDLLGLGLILRLSPW